MNIDDIKDTIILLDTTDLKSVVAVAQTELQRRQNIAAMAERDDQAAREYSTTVGRTDYSPWAPPSGRYDGYPKASIVTHNNRLWVNTIPANTQEPGGAGWVERTYEDTLPLEWTQPTSEEDAYRIGDAVIWNGWTYRSTENNNVWDPNGNPTGWIRATVPDKNPLV